MAFPADEQKNGITECSPNDDFYSLVEHLKTFERRDNRPAEETIMLNLSEVIHPNETTEQISFSSKTSATSATDLRNDFDQSSPDTSGCTLNGPVNGEQILLSIDEKSFPATDSKQNCNPNICETFDSSVCEQKEFSLEYINGNLRESTENIEENEKATEVSVSIANETRLIVTSPDKPTTTATGLSTKENPDDPDDTCSVVYDVSNHDIYSVYSEYSQYEQHYLTAYLETCEKPDTSISKVINLSQSEQQLGSSSSNSSTESKTNVKNICKSVSTGTCDITISPVTDPNDDVYTNDSRYDIYNNRIEYIENIDSRQKTKPQLREKTNVFLRRASPYLIVVLGLFLTAVVLALISFLGFSFLTGWQWSFTWPVSNDKKTEYFFSGKSHHKSIDLKKLPNHRIRAKSSVVRLHFKTYAEGSLSNNFLYI